MTELAIWFRVNNLKLAERGIDIPSSLPEDASYLDGDYGSNMFRFIDREQNGVDIEIIDCESGETVQHGLTTSGKSNFSIYDDAIDFILQLKVS